MYKTKEQTEEEFEKRFQINGNITNKIKDFILEIREDDLDEIIKLVDKTLEIPPFNADKENPLKHIYQNEGYRKAENDLLEELNKLK